MKPRIAILYHVAPPMIGGIETVILHTSRLLVQNGYSTRVIAGRGEPWHSGIELILVPEIDFISFEERAKYGNPEQGEAFSNAFKELQARIYLRLDELLRNIDICIVHNVLSHYRNLPFTAALLELIACYSSKSFVAWSHGLSWVRLFARSDFYVGYPWDVLRTLPDNLTFVVPSEYRRTELCKLLSIDYNKIYIVNPGITWSHFFNLEPSTAELFGEQNLINADILLLMPCRISERKNIEFALLIVAELVNQGVDVRLLVTGPADVEDDSRSEYVSKLLQLCKELKIERNILFLHFIYKPTESFIVTNRIMSDLYQICDALLFPSKEEGFGIALLEAGIARLPVFCANISPLREVAAQFATYFDLDMSPTVVATRIRNRLNDDFAFGLRKRILQQFSWQHVFDTQLEPLILSISR